MRESIAMAWFGAVLVLVLALAPAAARADTPPWAVGVTDAEKARAKALLDEGNALFLEGKHAEALERYRAAVAIWDHPAIRFNMVRCLIQLERMVEAYDDLKRALKYGAAPLEDAVYREARGYERLLARQISDLEIRCAQAGVALTLDGKPLATCPAREARRLAPGRHQVVGTKDGFVPRTVDVIAVGGERQEVDVTLVPLRAARIEHRFATWVPWTVFAGGLAVGGFGVVIELKAGSDMRQYDRTLAIQCPNGCAPGEVDTSLKSSAELEEKVAIAVIGAGIATAATGAILLYMNRGRTVYPDRRGAMDAPKVGIVSTSSGAALTVGGRF